MDVKIDVNLNVASKFAEGKGKTRALVYLQQGEKKGEYNVFLDSGKLLHVIVDMDFDSLCEEIFAGVESMFPEVE
ncbi:MAG: hypothetical protein WBB73_13695 [Candidatus Aminicenantaceae bacterium]|jgi:hypothetical protein